jgi:hypothetical protein
MQALGGLSGHLRFVEGLGLLLWLLPRGEGNGLDIRVQRAWVILASSDTRPPDSQLDSMSAGALQPAVNATLKKRGVAHAPLQRAKKTSGLVGKVERVQQVVLSRVQQDRSVHNAVGVGGAEGREGKVHASATVVVVMVADAAVVIIL